MPVDTTFLPKTSRLVFDDRLLARANKGRVFLLTVAGDEVVEPPPTIGEVTINPDTTGVALNSNSTFNVVVTGGDATDFTYKWTVRSGNALLLTPNNESTATYNFTRAGTVQIQCAVYSAGALNTPQTNVSFVIVS